MTKDSIKYCIYKYGVFPALVLLREEQDAERFENCSLIKETIEELFDGRWYGLSTKVDDSSLDSMLETLAKQSNDPEGFREHRVHEYVQGFKNEIK